MAHAAWAQEEVLSREPASIRLVFSSRYLAEVNESDARAALLAWSEALVRERHIRAEVTPEIVDGLPALDRALKTKRTDMIAVPAEEYLDLGTDPHQSTFILALVGGRIQVEYLLLVHQDSDITDLAGLKGRTILMYDSVRTCLAMKWLDTSLLEAGLPPASRQPGRVTPVKKLTGSVLPVFFRQADACVVTRDGLESLAELNPQIGSRLRVLATSPGLLPSLGYIRPRTDGSLDWLDLQKEIEQLHTTAAGKQILNLFKADRLVVAPASHIESARTLLSAHRRLMASWESAGIKPRPGKTVPRSAALGGASGAAPGGGGQ